MGKARRLSPSTYTPHDRAQLARIFDRLAANESSSTCYLVGSSDEHPIELPNEVYQVLRNVVEAKNDDLSVTISHRSQVLTTPQAADLLGVSRPLVL